MIKTRSGFVHFCFHPRPSLTFPATKTAVAPQFALLKDAWEALAALLPVGNQRLDRYRRPTGYETGHTLFRIQNIMDDDHSAIKKADNWSEVSWPNDCGMSILELTFRSLQGCRERYGKISIVLQEEEGGIKDRREARQDREYEEVGGHNRGRTRRGI